MSPSHLHVVAGMCVLAVGVMIAAPAVATADPDTDNVTTSSVDDTSTEVPEGMPTATSDPDSAAGAEPNAADSAADSAGAAERNAVEGVTSTVGSGRSPGDPVLATESSDAQTNAGESDPVAVDPEPVNPESGADTNNSEPVAPAAAESTGNEPEPATEADALADTEATPAAEAPVTAAATPIPYLALLGVGVTAPISDVITAVELLLAEIVIAPLAQLQRDLALLFAVAGVGPATDSLARLGIELPRPVRDALWSKFSPHAPVAVPLTATSTDATMLASGTPAAAGDTRPAAPLAADESVSAGVHSFIEDITRKLLESPTLMALAVAALPGVAGLLVLTASGVRLGYRQAKARLAVHVQGIARFVPVEPVDDQRCGTLVFLRPWASRAPGLNATPVVDEAA